MKRTKKWEDAFEKRYSKVINELQELEKEYNLVKSVEDNETWYKLFPENCLVEFGSLYGFQISHVKENQIKQNQPEYINITLRSELGGFSFDLENFNQVEILRDELLESLDKMNGGDFSVSIKNDVPDEDDEDWENNEEKEYTIQATRECVQTWTHTVKAKSAVEAYRKAEDGEGHDENDEFGQYGDIDWEEI